MKVYLAAPWVRRETAKEVAKQIEDAGHYVTSRWLLHPGDPADSTGASLPIEVIRKQADEDIEDILKADVMIVLNLEKSEGKAVETGFALSEGIPIISVGKRGNIFLSLTTEVDTVEEAIGRLN